MSEKRFTEQMQAYGQWKKDLITNIGEYQKWLDANGMGSPEDELRIYESHSMKKGQKKIEMFNTGGELDIFGKVGLTPVFFGEALVGLKLPNLTYMLGFDNEEAKEAAWKAFLAHPDWKKLKIVLRPSSCSQI